jgi:hypothetical protein
VERESLARPVPLEKLELPVRLAPLERLVLLVQRLAQVPLEEQVEREPLAKPVPLEKLALLVRLAPLEKPEPLERLEKLEPQVRQLTPALLVKPDRLVRQRIQDPRALLELVRPEQPEPPARPELPDNQVSQV